MRVPSGDHRGAKLRQHGWLGSGCAFPPSASMIQIFLLCLNTIRVPSGEYWGALSQLWVRRVGVPPSAGTVQISSVGELSLLSSLVMPLFAYTIVDPSGDQEGHSSCSSSKVSRARCEPSASTTDTCPPKPLFRMKAIREPSGDHERNEMSPDPGPSDRENSLVRKRRWVPSIPTTPIRLPVENAMVRPSGAITRDDA